MRAKVGACSARLGQRRHCGGRHARAERGSGWTGNPAAVHEELVTDPLIDADDIVVEVFNGKVVLNGTVPSGPMLGGGRSGAASG